MKLYLALVLALATATCAVKAAPKIELPPLCGKEAPPQWVPGCRILVRLRALL